MSLEQLEQRVTCIAWNNEGTNLAVGLPHGFIIYSTELLLDDNGWLHEVLRRSVVGGVGIIALHGQTNVVLFSGWTFSHRFTVMIYDLAVNDTQGEERSVLARVTLSSGVNALRFHPCLVMVGVESGYVHLFNHLLQKIESFQVSRRGRMSSRAAETMSLATMLVEKPASGMCFSLLHGVFLGPTTGTVRCIRYVSEKRVELSLLQRSLEGVAETTTNPLKEKVVEIHRNEVQCIAITSDGTRALTVSERGTSLKLLDVERGFIICQFSRGKTPNGVQALALLVSSIDAVAVCVSDTGTLHLFHVPVTDVSSHQADVAANADTAGGDKLLRAWNDYRNSLGPKSRLSIPDDGLYDVLCARQTCSRPTYSITLRPIAKRASCVAHVLQRNVSSEGLAAKVRLLSIRMDLTTASSSSLSDAKCMEVVRSFYFPKDEL